MIMFPATSRGTDGAKKNRSFTKKGPGRMPYNRGKPAKK